MKLLSFLFVAILGPSCSGCLTMSDTQEVQKTNAMHESKKAQNSDQDQQPTGNGDRSGDTGVERGPGSANDTAKEDLGLD